MASMYPHVPSPLLPPTGIAYGLRFSAVKRSHVRYQAQPISIIPYHSTLFMMALFRYLDHRFAAVSTVLLARHLNERRIHHSKRAEAASHQILHSNTQ